MNRKNLRNILTTAALAAAASFAATRDAQAVPVTGVYTEDPRCDAIPSQTLTHELGEIQFFPLNEALIINVSPAPFTVCVPDDGIQNDWIVDIQNVSGQAWTNLFFVGDLGLTVGNADGNMIDVVNAPGVVTDAFRIDGTVTVGLNNNLLGESQIVDEILAPGENWRFTVSNYADAAGTAPPPLFRLPGVFAGSEPFNGTASISTASILANPVPEPTTIGAAIVAAAALLMRRPAKG
jgi:hypothetical protein